MTLGEKIAKQRKGLNYTQEQLAEILSVSRQSVSKWESGLAYPETDKLLKMGRLFGCSMDYLLKDEITDPAGIPAPSPAPSAGQTVAAFLCGQFRERKSEKILWGMPLYHIGRNARGVFAIGLNARGILAIGLKAKGIVSLGALSMGLLSIGVLSLGLLSVGSIALGLLAAGAISMGIISFGALSVGCFSSGALAIGRYIAVGDYARAMIAIGESQSIGTVYLHSGSADTADLAYIQIWLDANVPVFLSWAKEIFQFYLG